MNVDCYYFCDMQDLPHFCVTRWKPCTPEGCPDYSQKIGPNQTKKDDEEMAFTALYDVMEF